MKPSPDITSPVYICGPTASGKSALALELASCLDGEIVNADAYQLYRGLEVISAAPDSDELARAPHHLYGITKLIKFFCSFLMDFAMFVDLKWDIFQVRKATRKLIDKFRPENIKP